MKAVFMGTPDEAVPILRALVEVAEVSLVITRPDKPRGRSRKPESPPIKNAAEELHLPVSQPMSGSELLAAVETAEPDVAVLAAYGRLIEPGVLALPAHGFVNVHFSLLPRWRGASPVVRAILAGDSETGVSLMAMDAGLDTGPVIAARAVDIDPADTAGSLTEKLAKVGGALLGEELLRFTAGEIRPVPQDDDRATAAGKVTTDEAHIDPIRHSAVAVDRAVRAFNPKPGAWCLLDGERFKIWKAAPSTETGLEPGTAVLVAGKVLLGTPSGVLQLDEVQPSGKAVLAATAWMNGRRGESAALA